MASAITTPAPTTWVVLPGLLLAPSDMEPVARVVREQFPDATVRVLDSWDTAVTAPVAAIRAELGLADDQAPGSVGLVGHSVGGLAAIEWALTHPEELGAVLLLDPTTPFLPRRPERPAPVGLTLLAERVVHTSGLLLSRCGAVTRRGPALRRRAWYDATHRPDPLPDDEAVRRYGTPEAWRLLTGQYEQSWAQAERVTALFARDAAAMLEELSAAYQQRFGEPIGLTDSFRSYASQVSTRAAKPGLAAVPGTSNHGWGLAIDLTSPASNPGSAQYKWLRANAPLYGWDNPPWARSNGSKPEPWHFEYASGW